MTENADQIAPHDRAARACYEGRFQGELARVPEWDKLPEYAKDRWRSAVAAVLKVSPASTHGSRLNEAALQTAMEYSTSVMADIDTAEMREAIRIYLDAAAPAAPPAPESHVGPDLKEIILLQIIAASGGTCDSSDHSWNWINWFCNDETERNGTDTFNRCNDKGWLHTTHNTDFDTSTTTLTAAGRAFLATTEGSDNG